MRCARSVNPARMRVSAEPRCLNHNDGYGTPFATLRRRPVPADKKETDSKTGARKRRIPRLVHKAQLTVQINLAARLTNQAARIRMGEIGAWPGQIPILLWLLERDGIIQKELVELVNMEQSS